MAGAVAALSTARLISLWHAREEKATVMELMTHWKREGIEIGREEGELAIVLRLLKRRFGPLPAGMRQEISDLTRPRLEALADALLDFSKGDDLRRWLERASR